MIELRKINKIYNNKVQALNNVDLKFDKVGLNFIIGKSGSGKSTLLNIIGCLDTFEAGNYYFSNKDISNSTLEELDKIRNYYFGFVFQDFLLAENMNVLENILFSLNLQNDQNYDKVYEIMKELDIYDLKDRKITEISGGQKQRVAIARALVKNPSVILADEPTGNLDEVSRKNIYELLKKLSEKYLVIIVSHDLMAACQYADRIIKLEDGKVIEDKINYVTKYYVKDNKNNTILSSSTDKYDLLKFIENSNESYSLSIEKEIEEKKELKDIEIKEVDRIDKLPNKVIFKYLKKSISSNKLRYILSTIFYSLTFFLLFLFVYLANYKSDIVIGNYIDKYNLNSFTLYKNITYTDKFDNTQWKSLYNGPLLKEELLEEFSSIHDVSETQIIKGEKYGNINCHFVDDSVYDLKENEVIITDYVASLYIVKKDDTIDLYDMTFTIKDIIQTDFESYELSNKLNDDFERPAAMNKKKYNYEICYVKESLKDKIVESYDGINLQASNFYYYSKNDYYYKTSLTYNTINKVDSTKLLYGRMPNSSNEVVVSSKYASDVILTGSIDYLIDKEYSYKDLSLDSYSGYYSDVINLYKYFNNGVKVVGIIDDDNSDVYVSNDIYNSILSDYKDSLFADYFIVGGFNTKNIKKLLSKDIHFDETNIDFINDSTDVLKEINNFIIVILIIFIIVAVFIILNYVITQIDKSKKQIGIMKALGVRNKDIIKLFIWEIMLLAIITIFIGFIMYCITLGIVNIKIINNITERPFNMLYFDLPTVLIVSTSILLVFILTSIIPIIRLSNKKPMIVIREE